MIQSVLPTRRASTEFVAILATADRMLTVESRTISLCARACRATTVTQRSSVPRWVVDRTTSAPDNIPASTDSACLSAKRTHALAIRNATASTTERCANANQATRAIQRPLALSWDVAATRTALWTNPVSTHAARVLAMVVPRVHVMRSARCTTTEQNAHAHRDTSTTWWKDVAAWRRSARMTEIVPRRPRASAASA